MLKPNTLDVPTLAAIGASVYTVSALAHEGLGHGGMCLAQGSRIIALTSTYLDCAEGLSNGGAQAVEAAGTLINLSFAVVAFAVLARAKSLSPWAKVFWWLLATVNGLQGAGYLLVSPLGHFGDWHALVQHAPDEWNWPLRITLTVLGLGLSLLVAMRSASVLSELAGDGEGRASVLRKLVWVPYAAGCGLDVLAGFFNPLGWQIVLVSSIGSAVFGTCWLVFVVPSIASKKAAGCPASPLIRSSAWLAAAAVLALVHLWFGRGFQPPS